MQTTLKAVFAVACCMSVAQSMKLQAQAAFTCSTTASRNKSPLPAFAEILAAGSPWTDRAFSHDPNALYWESVGEPAPEDVQGVEWKRISETPSLKNNSLWGSNGITVDDVKQGVLGNCWYKAAASALAEEAGRLDKVFHNSSNRLNSAGIYAVDFWSLGVPHTVVVDDYLPLMNKDDGTWGTVFAKVGSDKSMWPAILEKAFAKYHGNYYHTEGGLSMRAVQTLSGAPWVRYTNAEEDEDRLWSKLVEADKQKDVITCDTHSTPSGSHDEDHPVYGIAYNHAYTVIGAKVLSNGVKLVQVRNPWGTETYKGPWADSDSKWTDALREEAGRLSADDGVWHIPIKDFMIVMESTYTNKNNSNWKYDSFMRLNDSTQPGGSSSYCGAGTGDCVKHELTITSEIEQQVWVAGHRWDQRGYGGSCAPDGDESVSNNLSVEGWEYD